MKTIKIDKLDLYKVLNGEFIQLGKQIIDLVIKHNPDILKVQAQFDAFKKIMEEMDEMYGLLNSSKFTTPINEADVRRDRAITGISLTADARIYSYVKEEVAAAKILRQHIDKYGKGIARQGQNLESLNLRKLVQDIKDIKELNEAVTLLDLAQWVVEMSEANNIFEELFTQRNSELGQVPETKQRELRLQAYELFYALRDKLEAQANVNEYVQPFTQAIQDWNGTQLPFTANGIPYHKI